MIVLPTDLRGEKFSFVSQSGLRPELGLPSWGAGTRCAGCGNGNGKRAHLNCVLIDNLHQHFKQVMQRFEVSGVLQAWHPLERLLLPAGARNSALV